MEDPIRYETPPLLETVVIEVAISPDGRPVINVRGQALQAPAEALWERIILLIQLGLRAAIAQTIQAPAEASRIVQPSGFMVPPVDGQRH